MRVPAVAEFWSVLSKEHAVAKSKILVRKCEALRGGIANIPGRENCAVEII
jgi:hypothetical protein